MYRGLTTFRFFAFFMVFLAHFNWSLFGTGFLGVQAFFVLSGFLLIPILVQLKCETSPKLYFKNFYGRRVLRIFPLYYGYLIGILVVSFFIANKNILQVNLFLDQAAWALTYSYNFFHASIFYEQSRFITHFWSLAVEEQFYLIWPIMILLVPSKHLKGFLLGTIFGGPVLRLLITLVIKFSFQRFVNPSIDLVLYVLPFSHFDAFAIGGFFSLYYKKQISNKWIFIVVIFSIFLGYSTQFLATGKIFLYSLGYLPFMDHQFIWSYSLINYIFAVLLIQIRDDKFFPIFFNNPFFHYLGKISYGLYVFHFGAQWLIWTIFPYLLDPVSFVLSFVITCVISSVSYEMFEKHFINLKDKLFLTKTLLI